MPRPKATPKICRAAHRGEPCVLEYGLPAHKLRRCDATGLGLPTLIHRTARGREWVATAALDGIDDSADAAALDDATAVPRRRT